MLYPGGMEAETSAIDAGIIAGERNEWRGVMDGHRGMGVDMVDCPKRKIRRV